MATIIWESYTTGNVTITLTLEYTFTRTSATTGMLTCNYNCTIPEGDDSIHALGWGIPSISYYNSMKGFDTENYGYSGSFTQNITGLSASGGTINISAYMYRCTSSWSVLSTTDTRSTSITYGNVVPVITQSNITEIGATSFKINASSDIKCNTWQYRLGSGSWTTFKSSSATSASYTVTGLTPNTNYTVSIKATGTKYGATGTSGTKSATTLGGMVLNSAADFTLPNSFKIRATFYSASYSNYIDFKINGATVLTYNLGTQEVATNKKLTIALSQSNINALLNAVPSSTTASVTLSARSMNGQTQIGTSSTKTVTMTIGDTYKPTMGTPTYLDNNNSTVAVTGDNQNIVLGYSTVRLESLSASFATGATFEYWEFFVGDSEKISYVNDNYYNYGEVSSGTIRIRVTDTRGLYAEKTLNLSTTYYNKPSLNNVSLRRTNNVEEETYLSFNGNYISVGNNALTVAKININSTAINLLPNLTYVGNAYTLPPLDLGDYNVDTEYPSVITISDKISTYTLSVKLPKGRPLVSFRSQKVGINIKEPGYALDISGNTHMDNHLYLGDSGSNDVRMEFMRTGGYDMRFGYMNTTGQFYLYDVKHSKSIIYVSADGNTINFNGIIAGVAAEGTSGIWKYRKWNNGTIELWGLYPFTAAINGALGSIYGSNAVSVSLPSGLGISGIDRIQTTISGAYCVGRNVSVVSYSASSISIRASSWQSETRASGLNVEIYAVGTYS